MPTSLKITVGAIPVAGRTTSSARIRPASSTVASWSSCLEPKCAYRPLLLIPVAVQSKGDASLVG